MATGRHDSRDVQGRLAFVQSNNVDILGIVYMEGQLVPIDGVFLSWASFCLGNDGTDSRGEFLSQALSDLPDTVLDLLEVLVAPFLLPNEVHGGQSKFMCRGDVELNRGSSLAEGDEGDRTLVRDQFAAEGAIRTVVDDGGSVEFELSLKDLGPDGEALLVLVVVFQHDGVFPIGGHFEFGFNHSRFAVCSNKGGLSNDFW